MFFLNLCFVIHFIFLKKNVWKFKIMLLSKIFCAIMGNKKVISKASLLYDSACCSGLGEGLH